MDNMTLLGEYNGHKLYLPDKDESCKICGRKDHILYIMKKTKDGYYGFFICQDCISVIKGLYADI